MGDFEFPSYWSFPPMFTIQPVQQTRQKQMDNWVELVLQYFRHHKAFAIDVDEAANKPPFFNSAIDRVQQVLQELVNRGSAEWKDKNKRRCMIMWRRPEEWAKLLYQWVQDTAQVGSVTTLWELHSGDETKDQEFWGLDHDTLVKALEVLEAKGRAKMFNSENTSAAGVKFL